MAKLNISKLDAAKRQLITAIQLFLRNGDPVSIHTLTGAAYGILKDYAKNENVPILFDFEKYIKPEKMKDVIARANKPQNFFKHANNDYKEIIEFNPEITTLYLWDSTIIYQRITNERIPILVCFMIWFVANNKKEINEMFTDKTICQTWSKIVANLDSNDRKKFLEFQKILEDINFNLI